MLSLGLEQTAPLIMTVANLRYVKGIDVLLRAISMVRREFPAVVFAFVGESLDAGYARELFALTAELGITQNTRFLGPRTDVFSLLKMADVFCLPSRTEGLSNALLEAMACGLPCVATDVGGNAEVLADRQSGFLVPSERPEVLAERLLALLRDQNLRRRMGNCGRQIVQERFTVQHMVDRLGMLYDDLLHRRSTSSARWRGQRHVPEIARTSPQ
jgi:glycosyltransferase involved in cell wall biosynthesis